MTSKEILRKFEDDFHVTFRNPIQARDLIDFAIYEYWKSKEENNNKAK